MLLEFVLLTILSYFIIKKYIKNKSMKKFNNDFTNIKKDYYRKIEDEIGFKIQEHTKTLLTNIISNYETNTDLMNLYKEKITKFPLLHVNGTVDFCDKLIIESFRQLYIEASNNIELNDNKIIIDIISKFSSLEEKVLFKQTPHEISEQLNSLFFNNYDLIEKPEIFTIFTYFNTIEKDVLGNILYYVNLAKVYDNYKYTNYHDNRTIFELNKTIYNMNYKDLFNLDNRNIVNIVEMYQKEITTLFMNISRNKSTIDDIFNPNENYYTTISHLRYIEYDKEYIQNKTENDSWKFHIKAVWDK